MATLPLDSTHPDYASVHPIVKAIYEAAGGRDEFEVNIPIILRTAIDEVIDTPRTGRFLLEQTEKTEKTYLGTKVEILVRAFLKFSKGSVLDMNVKGAEVDIKNTMGTNWSIPRENVGRPALLIRSSEAKSLCDIGVAVLHDGYLNPGQNQDAKRGVSAAGAANIWWMLRQHPYPVNFWQLLSDSQRKALINAGGGSARIAALFEMVQGRPISRVQIQGLARQLDYMKRIRRNGGARDILAPKGIAIFSGVYDQEPIKHLGLGLVTREEFISYTPKSTDEVSYLRRIGHID
ncbi:NaeI family type II restriction endonuclease [uncultured Nitratireductor sp.]|uniref:NaeI family type II restriction endonuclease n=1 Tax=uncultured Nitratireductor sp. TaxID=520953 RepID=UPI0025CE88FE|nr:NaeI family type II restriction endonuclease [uncultured Nitratireductor sp.]